MTQLWNVFEHSVSNTLLVYSLLEEGYITEYLLSSCKNIVYSKNIVSSTYHVFKYVQLDMLIFIRYNLR